MNEFKKNDVIVEIGNNKKLFWIVDMVVNDGYFVASFWDGRIHMAGTWMSFRTAHESFIKVDEWDNVNMKMKNVEEI